MLKKFREFLGEAKQEDAHSAEYKPVLKKHFFKKYVGVGQHHHPLHGVVKINKHGEWEHTHPSGGKFEGTTGESLDRHLTIIHREGGN